MALDLTEILHNLEINVLERKEEKTISSIEAFNQDNNDSGVRNCRESWGYLS